MVVNPNIKANNIFLMFGNTNITIIKYYKKGFYEKYSIKIFQKKIKERKKGKDLKKS